MIYGTVPSSVHAWMPQVTTVTWSLAAACFRLLQRQRGRHDRRWSCATTVEHAHWHMLWLSCYRKKLQNLSHLNCGLQICQIWIQLITACGKFCKRRCTKMHHCSGTINDATNEWLPQWRPSPALGVIAPLFSVAVSVRAGQWLCALLR